MIKPLRSLVGWTLFGAFALLARSTKREPAATTAPFSPELEELIRRSRPKLTGLRPEIQPMIEALLVAAFEQGISLIITDGFRSVAEQDRIFAQGRTAPGPIVTGARGGQSWHNYGLAADVALLVSGRPTWPNDLALWARIGALGKALGLRWGGDFPTPDRPHFELRLTGVGPGLSPPGVVA